MKRKKSFVFQKIFHLHKFFDVISFPFDFQSKQKNKSRQVKLDVNIGKCSFTGNQSDIQS